MNFHRQFRIYLTVAMVQGVVLLAATSCSSPKTDAPAGPKPPEAAASVVVLTAVDKEVRSALTSTTKLAMSPPRWGPDLDGAAANNKAFWARVATWGPGHYEALLRYMTTLDPAQERNVNQFIYGQAAFSVIAKGLTPESRALVALAYGDTGFMPWWEHAAATKDGIYYSAESHLIDLVVLGVQLGGVDPDQVLMRLLARVQQEGWEFHLEVAFSWIDGADPVRTPALSVVQAFSETNAALKADATRLGTRELSRFYIVWWQRSKDPAIRSRLLELYLALPTENEDSQNWGHPVVVPPGRQVILDLISAKPELHLDEVASQFICTVLTASNRFDEPLATLLSMYRGPYREFATRLLLADIPPSFKARLEGAIAREDVRFEERIRGANGK